MKYKTLTKLIGNTPLLKIENLSREAGANIWAKCEFLNPGGSVKDRIAKSMIDAAFADGKLKENGHIVEPTSGNTGIGLALVCAQHKLKLTLTMPESMSTERRKLLKYLGAELVLTPASEGMNGAISKAKEIVQKEGAIMLDQFSNPANPLAHYKGTGPEIFSDLGTEISTFIAAVGTGGTLTGTGEYLSEKVPDLSIFAVEPEDSAVLSGKSAGSHAIQGIGAGFIPPILNRSIISEVLTVSNDEAFSFARRAAKEEGLLIGISSGANLAAAFKIANRPEFRSKNIVTILPDGSERYISTSLLN